MLKTIKKADIYLGIGLLMFGGILSAFLFFYSAPGAEVEVSQGGKLIGVYDLSKERKILITDGGVISTAKSKDGTEWAKAVKEKPMTGDYNLLEIKGGKVKMLDANCPDRYCVKHKAIDRTNETIVCLPHKLIVTIKGGKEQQLDAVTN